MILAGLAALALVPAPPKPNIVFIMADDLGYGDIGAYGQEKIPTPNLDRLAREGMKFTRAYSASAVCAPTRYSLLSGRHQGRASIRGNKEQGDFTPNGREGQFPVKREEVLLPEVLKSAGYRTGLVGKWGLGGPAPGQTPNDHGFDRFYGYLCQRRAHSFYPTYLWSDSWPDQLGNPLYAAHQRIQAPLATEDEYYQRYGGVTYAPERLAQECVKFIRDVPARTPFFLYYAPTLPHVALQAPKEWVDRFPRSWDEKPYLGQNGYLPNPRPRATYAAMVAYLDHTVGQLMAELERKGVAQNTLVIFTSDNGAVQGAGGADVPFFKSNGPFRAGKMSLYEGGVRVPFLAWWPGQIPAGTTSTDQVISYDAMPTLAQLAGAKPPRNDGRSYLPALLGKSMPKRSHLYFEYPEASVMQAVTWDRFKAIRPKLKENPSKLEIYDLEQDPGETRDLASERPDLVREGLRVMEREHQRNLDFPLTGVDPQGSRTSAKTGL